MYSHQHVCLMTGLYWLRSSSFLIGVCIQIPSHFSLDCSCSSLGYLHIEIYSLPFELRQYTLVHLVGLWNWFSSSEREWLLSITSVDLILEWNIVAGGVNDKGLNVLTKWPHPATQNVFLRCIIKSSWIRSARDPKRTMYITWTTMLEFKAKTII